MMRTVCCAAATRSMRTGFSWFALPSVRATVRRSLTSFVIFFTSSRTSSMTCFRNGDLIDGSVSRRSAEASTTASGVRSSCEASAANWR